MVWENCATAKNDKICVIVAFPMPGIDSSHFRLPHRSGLAFNVLLDWDRFCVRLDGDTVCIFCGLADQRKVQSRRWRHAGGQGKRPDERNQEEKWSKHDGSFQCWFKRIDNRPNGAGFLRCTVSQLPSLLSRAGTSGAALALRAAGTNGIWDGRLFRKTLTAAAAVLPGAIGECAWGLSGGIHCVSPLGESKTPV